MSFIRAVGVIRSCSGNGRVPSSSCFFSTSSACFKMSTRSRKPPKFNSFERKKALQFPFLAAKRTGSKKRLLEKKPYKRKGGPVQEEKLGYGEYSALKEITQKDTRNAENLVSKIETFEALKLLPVVRNAVVESIREKTVLNSSNYIGPSPNQYEEKFDSEGKLIPNQATNSSIEIKPSPIQVAAIKILSQYILKPELSTFTIAAETGSGKTWAYMAPLIDALKHEELTEDWERVQEKAIIRSIVLVPTHELVDQVYQSIKDVFEKLELKCYKWDTGSSHKDFVDHLKGRIDLLITTPGKVNSIQNIRMIARPQYVFARTKFLVVDEADTLMDRSWIDDTCGAIRRLPNLNNLVFCSATIPAEFNKAMEKLFPTAIPVTTPSLHKLPKTIKFSLIDASVQPYQGSKVKALAQALYAIHRDSSEEGYEKRCIVFVNEKKDVQSLAYKLRESYNHDVVFLTGEDSAEMRAEKVGIFLNPPRRLEDIEPEKEEVEEQVALPDSNIVLQKKKSNHRGNGLKVLITTDLLARGLNFSAVRNVILYDVPNTSADLVHRAGRTGRMNQAGRVFLIIDKKAKSWVKRLPKVVRSHGLIT